MGLITNHKKQLNDEDLLRNFQVRGDAEALGFLYDRYLHLVYGLCLKYLKSREAAQDAVMDIYEILTRKLPDQEVRFFKSWLYMVSKNHCLMQLRKKDNGVVMEESFMEFLDDTHLNDEPPVDSDLKALEDCISALRPDQQQCVRLFYLQQKSYAEIVAASSFKMSKVKSYIQNGKRNLKICLEQKHVRR
ncbi:RNA polymerase sigma factor [Marinoscillum sp. MHG1-6]|uniref:RNA polymerase sigma factor n=1 Tax=Marinoscillum sp. MHG1-6 TaxID=2959627 RepID=UPI00215739B1|nr:sigma-70 family RNA polymerase sigma factor [Marinoscillum sp. MHG1-6]